MPVAYLNKLSKTTGKDIGSLEKHWSAAKASAASSGQGDNYAYITSVFKKMAGVNESEDLNEGLIKTAVDWFTAIRIVRMLALPWTSQEVYKLGLVTATGQKLKKAETDKEKEELTPLVKLVLNLKRLFDKVPYGSQIGSVAAGYAMLREHCLAEDIDTEQLDEMFTALCEDKGITLTEDTPVCTTAGVAGHTSPLTKTRNKWKDLDRVAGAHTFEVDDDLFHKTKLPKEKGASWDGALDGSETSNKIKQFAKSYSNKPIMLRRAGSQEHTWLRK